MSANDTFLKNFFEETDKVDPEGNFDVEVDGVVHFFTYGVVIEAINGAPEEEKSKVVTMLRKIDFHNGDVADYLRHLGKCLARMHG